MPDQTTKQRGRQTPQPHATAAPPYPQPQTNINAPTKLSVHPHLPRPNPGEMSIEVLDAETIRSFVEDEHAFNLLVEEHFAGISGGERRAVDLEEFRSETKKMMLAMANGLGVLPMQVALEEDSFLKKVVERAALANVTA